MTSNGPDVIDVESIRLVSTLFLFLFFSLAPFVSIYFGSLLFDTTQFFVFEKVEHLLYYICSQSYKEERECRRVSSSSTRRESKFNPECTMRDEILSLSLSLCSVVVVPNRTRKSVLPG